MGLQLLMLDIIITHYLKQPSLFLYPPFFPPTPQLCTSESHNSSFNLIQFTCSLSPASLSIAPYPGKPSPNSYYQCSTLAA